MKKILLLLVVIVAVGFSSLAVKKTLHRLPVAPAVPVGLLTHNNLYWSASITSAAGYKKMEPVENGQTVLTQAQFKKDGTFDFIFSKINALQQLQTEITIAGKVEFTKTEKGKNSFITTAVKGICREIKNGAAKEYALPEQELETFSGSWLWEKICFRDIPSEDFLLLINLKAHPSVWNAASGSIDKSWVSKFYTRK